MRSRVIVLGGGLSGAAAAYALAASGAADVTVLERGPTLGGLAGSFEREPAISIRSATTISCTATGRCCSSSSASARWPTVRWRRVRMLFHLGGRSYDLGTPGGLWSFPMSLGAKAGLVRLMLKAFGKRDWGDWQDRSAADLVDTYAGAGRREALFERLTRLKFELPVRRGERRLAGRAAPLSRRLGAARLHSGRQLDQGAVRRRRAPAGRARA